MKHVPKYNMYALFFRIIGFKGKEGTLRWRHKKIQKVFRKVQCNWYLAVFGGGKGK